MSHSMNAPGWLPAQPLVLIVLGLCLGSPGAQANCALVANNTAATPDSRFVINGDGTVTDTSLELMWTVAPISGGPYTQIGAGVVAINSTFAGYTNWRLPTRAELSGIVETGCTNPALNTTVFSINATTTFWTGQSTGSAGYSVDFTHGISQTESVLTPKAVRLVRTALNGVFADGFE